MNVWISFIINLAGFLIINSLSLVIASSMESTPKKIFRVIIGLWIFLAFFMGIPYANTISLGLLLLTYLGSVIFKEAHGCFREPIKT